MLKRIFVVRHGDYEGNFLTSKGVADITRLAEIIRPSIVGQKGVIFSSVSMRALRSANVLGGKLVFKVEANAVFFSDDNHPPAIPVILELITRKMEEVEVLIIVTHLEVADELPAYIAERFWDGRTYCGGEIRRGEAWNIDLEARTCTLMPL